MKHKFLILFAVVALLSVNFSPVHAQSIAASVSGRILLDVEQHGEAWYVYPPTLERYYLKDGEAAYEALRTFGLGITDADLAKIFVEGSATGGGSMAERLSGRILLQVQQHGEAWYVNPSDLKRYYLKDGNEAYRIMRYLSLGITSANLAQITISSSSPRPPFDDASNYDSYTITTNEGSFAVRVVMLRRDTFELVTDTGNSSDCLDDCPAEPLENYAEENDAFAGIHGTYFCPPDYADCDDSTYSYYPPVFNSALGKMINDDSIVFHNRPMVVQTTDGQIHYFHRPDDFGDTLADYEDAAGLKVNAAIGNWPSLVENSVSVVSDEPMESSFYNLGTRGGMGWDDDYFYLVIASSATVPNLAAIFEALNVDYAMNLDGGGSAALYYDGSYKTGPGRLLPNAVLFREKGR